jgi:diketogulonate reductase-like aldo/keto reductase
MFKVADAETTVSVALAAGYRLIDAAASYGNESGVGSALAACALDRSEFFVTSKVPNSAHGRSSTMQAFVETVSRLGLDFVDLYLIHWPVPAKDLYVETWAALEEIYAIYASGRARAIGVSNFRAQDLDRLAQRGGVVPAVNQIELHPGFVQEELRSLHRSMGITTQAWSPLGRGSALLGQPAVTSIATAMGRTPAQVVIRWHVEENHALIPKSTNASRLAENLDVFDFQLSPEDHAALSRLTGPGRVGPDPDTFDLH